jgi:hypothetical protein
MEIILPFDIGRSEKSDKVAALILHIVAKDSALSVLRTHNGRRWLARFDDMQAYNRANSLIEGWRYKV